MITGMARNARFVDPRRVKVLLDGKERWSEMYRNNPHIVTPGEYGDYQSLHARVNKLRPYMTYKTPTQWGWKAYRPPSGELYFNQEELRFGRHNRCRIIVDPHIKPSASPNKRWPFTYWQQLVNIARRAGHRITQIGAPGAVALHDVEFIQTPSARMAAAMMATAQVAILNEGGLMHVAAAVHTPAIVIFGAFISPQVTGYDDHIHFYRGNGLGCGMRVPCMCCQRAMQSITPQEVAQSLISILDKNK